MSKHVVRYRIDITIQGEHEYDPANPDSYKAALDAINEKRQAAIAAGGRVTLDKLQPVKAKA